LELISFQLNLENDQEIELNHDIEDQLPLFNRKVELKIEIEGGQILSEFRDSDSILPSTTTTD